MTTDLAVAGSSPPSGAPVADSNKHYDQDPQLFGLFLDSSRKYSSGLFTSETDSLDQAQQQKLDFVAAQLELRPGQELLDIGCGWGALACHMAKHHGARVLGLTPSPKQADFIRQRANELGVGDRVRIETSRIEDIQLPSRSFDAVTMLGSIIHMRDKGLVVKECHRLLKARGRVYLSESCFRSEEVHREFISRPGSIYVSEGIFGWGELLPLSRYVRWFEDAGLSLLSLTDLTRHYHRTIELWGENALRNREAIDRIEAGLTDRLTHYFDISNAGWGYTSKHYALTGGRAR